MLDLGAHAARSIIEEAAQGKTMVTSAPAVRASANVGLFSTGSESAAALISWWHALTNDPGACARLRRCHCSSDTVLHPFFHRLAGRLPDANAAQLAPLVWVLAHVKQHDEQRPFGAALAEKLSEIRFRRLLESPDREAAADDLRATVRFLGGHANVLELAQLIYFWGDRQRRRLATQYYGAKE